MLECLQARIKPAVQAPRLPHACSVQEAPILRILGITFEDITPDCREGQAWIPNTPETPSRTPASTTLDAPVNPQVCSIMRVSVALVFPSFWKPQNFVFVITIRQSRSFKSGQVYTPAPPSSAGWKISCTVPFSPDSRRLSNCAASTEKAVVRPNIHFQDIWHVQKENRSLNLLSTFAQGLKL